jgi:pyridoxine kinase
MFVFIKARSVYLCSATIRQRCAVHKSSLGEYGPRWRTAAVARIIALSSLVSRGHVGLRAVVPALEAFGHDVIALPTTILSSHAAHRTVAGMAVDIDVLERMASALDINGWLASADMLMTGYLPSVDHVAFAVALSRRLLEQNPTAVVVCDPVLGDAPKGLYVPTETARRVQSDLVPLAAILTPNAFELSWLSRLPVTSLATATSAARALQAPMVLATSVPVDPTRLATLLQTADYSVHTTVPLRPGAPSGTGDLLTGLFTGNLAAGIDPPSALAAAGAALEQILAASTGADDLRLEPLFAGMTGLAPLQLKDGSGSIINANNT